MAFISAYVVAARRSALGRVGGLHASRRIADLAVPVIAAALKDAKLDAKDVDELIVGCTSEAHNVARLVGLAGGLGVTSSAYTLDRQAASGLDAVVAGIRSIALGEAEVVVAGGAESLSTAPWRVVKPAALHQLPRFQGFGIVDDMSIEPLDELATRLGISRMRQDAWALRSHMNAEAARTAKRFIGEIVPIRANASEVRDEMAVEPSVEEIERAQPFSPGGTVTPLTASVLADGAAFVTVVSEGVWLKLGRPRGLKLVCSAATGVEPDEQGLAGAAALTKAMQQCGDQTVTDLARIEISESSALEALALAQRLDIDVAVVNPDGGAIARGHPMGAAGAVAVVRLFSGLLGRAEPVAGGKKLGAAVVGAGHGLGVAAVFETITG